MGHEINTKHFEEGMEALKNLKKLRGYAETIPLINDDEWEKEIALYVAEYEYYGLDPNHYAYIHDHAYDYVYERIKTHLRMCPYARTYNERKTMRMEKWEELGLTDIGISVENGRDWHSVQNGQTVRLRAKIDVSFEVATGDFHKCITLIRESTEESNAEAEDILAKALLATFCKDGATYIPGDDSSTAGFRELANFHF